MSLLLADVRANLGNKRRADGKRSVSLLPSELADALLLSNPRCRYALRLSYEIGDCMNGSDAHQEVDVIGHTADLRRERLESFEDGADIGVQIGAPCRVDVWNTILRAEYEMDMNAAVRRWHRGSVPRPRWGRIDFDRCPVVARSARTTGYRTCALRARFPRRIPGRRLLATLTGAFLSSTLRAPHPRLTPGAALSRTYRPRVPPLPAELPDLHHQTAQH